jgi:mRNA interferase MazF
LFRVELQPTLVNGLDATSRVMADKFTTVRRLRLTNRIGELTAGDLRRLERAVLVFLGFAGVSRPARGETANEDDT